MCCVMLCHIVIHSFAIHNLHATDFTGVTGILLFLFFFSNQNLIIIILHTYHICSVHSAKLPSLSHDYPMSARLSSYSNSECTRFTVKIVST